MFYHLFLSFGTFIATLVGVRLTILTLRRKQALLDIPNLRSNHKVPVPRGGGIAVVFCMVIFLMLADASYMLIAGILLLASVSLIDDWIRLAPLTRLVAQLFAVLLVLHEISLPELSLLPGWLGALLVAVAWLWFINLFNFMDGIDGISGAEMSSIGAGILLISVFTEHFSGPLAQYALIVTAAGIGFLWWNWHPAKIFLGDVGSIPIGFVLGYLLFMLAQEGFGYSALILPAYYLCDATITLAKRAWRRERVWEAHSEHFYQQAVRAGKSHDAVVRIIIGVNMLLGALAVLASLNQEIGWLYLSVAYGLVLAVLFFALASRKPHARPQAKS